MQASEHVVEGGKRFEASMFAPFDKVSQAQPAQGDKQIWFQQSNNPTIPTLLFSHSPILPFSTMRPLFLFAIIILATACNRHQRVHERPEWNSVFQKHGISDGCFIIRDHTHEEIFLVNKVRCTQRYSPASTFKIFNSLVALETGIAPDETLVIPWDHVTRWNADWNRDMNMQDAFKVSNVPYYQEIARRIGKNDMQHYLDTVQYGNKNIGKAIDSFWLNGDLQISADEQIGFIRKLYFNELPFSDRSQTIVKISLMLQEETPGYKLYYKTGWGNDSSGNNLLWVVGYTEKIVHMKEHENSMNKADFRNYPYFFAMNFSVPADNKTDWATERIAILKELLQKAGAI